MEQSTHDGALALPGCSENHIRNLDRELTAYFCGEPVISLKFAVRFAVKAPRFARLGQTPAILSWSGYL
jgi:hypothetical protein